MPVQLEHVRSCCTRLRYEKSDQLQDELLISRYDTLAVSSAFFEAVTWESAQLQCSIWGLL